MKPPPQIKIETLSQETLHQGFLGIDRRKVKIIYPEMGPTSIDDQIMTVDSVIRKANDAVAIVPYFTLNNEVYVYLRSCLRPAAMFRDYSKDNRPENCGFSGPGNLWEVPAGLVDKEEDGIDGLKHAAIRELHEEIGILVDERNINKLGPRYFSSAGMCAERIYFFEAEVNPLEQETPGEDGSPLEMGGEVIAVKLSEALNAIENEEILDAKTQMGLMRLAANLNFGRYKNVNK